MTEEFEEIADLTSAYRTNVNDWNGILGPPQPEREAVIQPPAHAVDLSGIGADPNGRGTASTPT